MTMNQFLSYAWLMLLVLFASQANANELSVNVDRNAITIEETLTLAIRYTGTDKKWEPDLTQVEAQFDIITQNRSNQYRYTNGRLSAYSEWTFVLMPRNTGRLLIPSFNVDNNYSDAIEVRVSEPTAPPPGVAQDVFLETIVDKSSIYVQEQLKVTYRLYYSVNIELEDVEPLDIPNVVIQELPDGRYRKNINGRQYLVAEFNYALFPQSSDNFEIPERQWKLRITQGGSRSIFDRLGRFKLKRLKTEQKSIAVKPVPQEFPADQTWLPAADIQVVENWSKAPEELTIGEPITRTITLTAKNLMSSQLPQVLNKAHAAINSNKLKVYAEQPKLNDEKTAQGILSEKTEAAAVVATKPGDISIPGIRIPWWDTTQNTLRYLEVPEHKVFLQGSTAQTDATDPQVEPSTANAPTNNGGVDSTEYQTLKAQLRLWQIITAALVILWIISLYFVWKFSQRAAEQKLTSTGQSATNKKRALQNLKHACTTNDAKAARDNLLVWASYVWPSNSPKTLSDINQKTQDPVLTNQILALDASLYGKQGNEGWNGNLLWEALKAWGQQQNKEKNANELAPLYPN